MQSLSAVVVGTNFGLLTHVPALRAAGFEVTALVGSNPEKTRARAEWAGIPLGTTSLTAALEGSEADLVAIATPPHTHAPFVLEAAKAGKHIVCEKPFARDADEAKAMLDAVEQAGVVHILGHEHRFDTAQAMATRAIEQGAIGDPRLYTQIMELPMFTDPATEVPKWWGDAGEGGGWLGANGIHMVDLARSFVGEFVGVSGSTWNSADHGWSAEDSFSLHFRADSGATGFIQSSIGARGVPLIVTRVVGSEGTLWMEGPKVSVADAKGQRTLEPEPALVLSNTSSRSRDFVETAYDELCAAADTITPYVALYETARDRVLGVEPGSPVVPATFHDGLVGQRILDAVRESSRRQGWVDLV